MLERTYRANRYEDALATAKRELGPDAMILSTRQIPGAGLLGGRPQIEIVASSASVASDTIVSSAVLGTSILERRLTRGGVPKIRAEQLASRVRHVIGDNLNDDDNLTNALAFALDEQIRFCSVEREVRSRVMAFAGPTGVGKTTTIAKIAARVSLAEGRNVALICMDRYKIGGAEQLERYADLIGIPMACAFDGDMLDRALDDFSDADLVLIDTEGRAPRDVGALEDLGAIFRESRTLIETQLCLAASMREAEMRKTVERMSVLNPKKLTITKLDEAVEFGNIIAAHTTSMLPLSYFTTGQRVPEDMEIATPMRLAAALCGEEFSE